MHTTRTILLSVGLAAVLTTSLSTAPVAATTSQSRVPAATTVTRTPATTTRPTPKSPVPHKVRRPSRTKAVMPTRATAALRPGLTSEPMTYHGGVLMTAPAHVYLVGLRTHGLTPRVATVAGTPRYPERLMTGAGQVFLSNTRRSPWSVRSGRCTVTVDDSLITTGASPPVAMTAVTAPPSSATIRVTMPSTCPAKP